MPQGYSPNMPQERELAQDSGWYSSHLGTGAACGSPSADAASLAPVGDPNHAPYPEPQRAQFRAAGNTLLQNVPTMNEPLQNSGFVQRYAQEDGWGTVAPLARVSEPNQSGSWSTPLARELGEGKTKASHALAPPNRGSADYVCRQLLDSCC